MPGSESSPTALWRYRRIHAKLRELVAGGSTTDPKTESNKNRASGLICKLLARSYLSGAPGAIRTHDPRLRRPMLYPPELQAR